MKTILAFAMSLVFAAATGCGNAAHLDKDAGTSTDADTDSDADTDTDSSIAGWSAGISVATDVSGDIYVTGYSEYSWNGPNGESPLHAHTADDDDAYDAIILKLSPSGEYLWHTFYGSYGHDTGNTILCDDSGNTYVIGLSDGSWNGPGGESPLHAHAIDDDNVFDVFVLKLGPSGEYLWHTFYGSSADDQCGSFVADGSGDIYITGQSGDSWTGPNGESPLRAHSGSADLTVLKLSADGEYLWHTFFGSSSDDYGGSAIADGSGDIYVAGTSRLSWIGPEGESPLHEYSHGETDDCMVIVVLKLSPSGDYLWHTFYGSSGNDYGGAVVADGSGDFYVSGTSEFSWTGPDGEGPLHEYYWSGDEEAFHHNSTVVKLSASGEYLWHTFYGSSGRSMDGDGNGNIYVSGHSDLSWTGPDGESPLHAYSGGTDFAVTKLSTNGAYQWHTFYGSSLNGECDLDYSIAADGGGNIYIVGESNYSWDGPDGESPLHAMSGGFGFRIAVLKLSESGGYQWHTFYGDSDD